MDLAHLSSSDSIERQILENVETKRSWLEVLAMGTDSVGRSRKVRTGKGRKTTDRGGGSIFRSCLVYERSFGLQRCDAS